MGWRGGDELWYAICTHTLEETSNSPKIITEHTDYRTDSETQSKFECKLDEHGCKLKIQNIEEKRNPLPDNHASHSTLICKWWVK